MFAKKLDQAEKDFTKRLRSYLKDADEKNVHDLRTAMRRTLACLRLLPKKMRDKKRLRRLVTSYKKLLKLNAELRDLDIILGKLSRPERLAIHNQLAKALRKKRKSKLKPARNLAVSLQSHPVPSVRYRELTGSKLQRRFDRVVGTLGSRIAKRLPVVLSDPTEKEALHLLREDARQLRYTLELAKTPNASNVTVLISWQDVLGAIHDSDVLMEYFQVEKPPLELRALIEEESSERNQNYDKFSNIAKESLLFKTDKSVD